LAQEGYHTHTFLSPAPSLHCHLHFVTAANESFGWQSLSHSTSFLSELQPFLKKMRFLAELQSGSFIFVAG
jgi:hypothetical protein